MVLLFWQYHLQREQTDVWKWDLNPSQTIPLMVDAYVYSESNEQISSQWDVLTSDNLANLLFVILEIFWKELSLIHDLLLWVLKLLIPKKTPSSPYSNYAL